MKTVVTAIWTSLAVAFGAAHSSAHAQAPIPQPAPAVPTGTLQGEREITQTARNTLAFDHFRLRPAQADPLVLRLGDGDYFQVRIVNTDPLQFSYAISAIPSEDERTPATRIGPTGDGIPATQLQETAVTMRHNKAFARYRVTIALRSDLQLPVKPREPVTGADPRLLEEQKVPKLYPAVFDVWVETKPGFETSFTGGVAFSGLVSPKFFIRTDNKGTADAADDTKTVEEDREARDGFKPDTVAVANFRHPEKLLGLELAVGVGLNNDADPRFFFGPSYFLGSNLLLTAGWSGGRVDRLPSGQELGRPPINGDNTLTTLEKKFEHSFFVGLAFSFIPKSEDNFKGGFAAAQKPAAEGGTPQAAPQQPAANVPNNAATGKFVANDKSVATVEELTAKSALITLPNKPATTFAIEGTAFNGSINGVATACSFKRGATAEGNVVTLRCLEGEKEVFLGTQAVKQ
jgi:hypothetical protein